MAKWLRTIDSAQRQITVEWPRKPAGRGPERLVFHIQGCSLMDSNGECHYAYADMAELGVRLKGERVLSLWDRLLRREARIGRLVFSDEGTVLLSLWTQPAIELVFDLGDDEAAVLFRECEIMVLSAGFHFRQEGRRERVYKAGIGEI